MFKIRITTYKKEWFLRNNEALRSHNLETNNFIDMLSVNRRIKGFCQDFKGRATIEVVNASTLKVLKAFHKDDDYNQSVVELAVVND